VARDNQRTQRINEGEARDKAQLKARLWGCTVLVEHKTTGTIYSLWVGVLSSNSKLCAITYKVTT
jgi:hypothetical protein